MENWYEVKRCPVAHRSSRSRRSPLAARVFSRRAAVYGRAELLAKEEAALLAEFRKSSKLPPCGTARQRGRGVFGLCENRKTFRQNSGKIYVSNLGKLNQTILSILDFIRLLFIKSDEHLRKNEHNIINDKINLDERF